MFHFFHSAWDHLGTYPFYQLSLLVWLLILLALTFDFLNGLHDAANSVATVVSTRVLSPGIAIIWAAFFNFAAFVVFPLKVAGTIQADVIEQDVINNQFLTATLVGACAWNIFTWYLGLPTSSSHALIGGMVGAAFVTAIAGADSVLGFFDFFLHLLRPGLLWIILFIILAPAIGFFLGTATAVGVSWLFHRTSPRRVDRIFRWGQLFSAGCFSLGHGGNDAQKTMGIILLLLINAGGIDPQQPYMPTEVVLACHLAMGLGTLFGGWRIVKTMGQRIIRLRPVDGFCAESGAAATLALTTFIKGIPISTTHTITGAIVGVGSLKRLSAVRWGVAGQVVWAWILTIPGSAVVAALTLTPLRLLF
jgi:PiT family inorganic phosphate transporter